MLVWWENKIGLMTAGDTEGAHMIQLVHDRTKRKDVRAPLMLDIVRF